MGTNTTLVTVAANRVSLTNIARHSGEFFFILKLNPNPLSGQTHYNRFYIENGAKERNGLRKHSFCAAA